MSAIVTNPDDVRRYVQEAVVEAIKAELPGLVIEATRPEFYTNGQVERLTGWSRRTLQHLRDTRQIDFVQHGRKISYPSKALHDLMERHRVLARGGEDR